MTNDKTKTDYYESLQELLSHYEEGWDIFKNAKTWEHPATKKASSMDVPNLPETWLDVVDRACYIIAVEKYGLDVYDNTIEIITSGQMLDNYASVGIPVNYEHWSFGKQRIIEEREYKQGKKGLAYEIVINTDPAIAYCMEGNSPLMQMLVIAHASYGHNSFFKGNYMFQQFTNAKTILDDMRTLRDAVADAEQQYGYEEVEKLLDACHALRMQDVNRYTKADAKTADEIKRLKDIHREERFNTSADRDIFSEVFTKNSKGLSVDKTADVSKGAVSAGDEENILRYIADNAPHLPEWKRHIMRLMCIKAQYFYPQGQTQVMNEGWASFWHYTILNDMADIGLIDDKMVGEFLESHAGVLYQPDAVVKQRNPMTGEVQEVVRPVRMNPYALGFAIFQDIKRICIDPTEEDSKWFPDIAGCGDWLGVFKEAMHNFKDESFILQYLSPKVIRDFKLFVVTDDEENEDNYEISAIHNAEGYQKVRESMSSNYRLNSRMPYIEAHEYFHRTDRSLVLHHKMNNGQPLDAKATQKVLKHIHYLWGHPVVIKSIDAQNTVKAETRVPRMA